MPSSPVPPFVDALRDHSLLTPAQHDEVARVLAPRMTDPRVLARHLLQEGWLTPYQVNQLFQGRGAELVMGPYLLLERLGEGGTGQVFKARHQRMHRVVAVKVIRPELLTDPEVVQRFYREVQVLSQLSHPNVVHAYDAGPFGTTHFLVMEYVEGTDLSQLVKRKGPIPVAQACDAIRQAACGLAHAHEKRLVHRDIKPSNLFLTRNDKEGPATRGPALIKILDLGLARLRRGAEGDITSTLTPVGASSVTMGTPDYLAPEQALDFHDVDIRADIYSLGCTFYYLLTGQPPFPGGSMAQKLMRHQQVPPPPLAKFRPDVPPAVEAVLQRMLAKRPEDRFQTPGDVAASLGETNFGAAMGLLPPPTARIDVRSTALLAPRRGKRSWLLLGGVAVLALVGVLAVILLAAPRKNPPESPSVTQRPLPTGTNSISFPVKPTASRVPPLPGGEYAIQGRPAVHDALINPSKAAQSLGTQAGANELVRGQNQCSAFLIHFDPNKLGLSSRGRIAKAILSFYVWDPHDRAKTKVCAFAVQTPWDEATVTWNQAAANRPWKGGKSFTFGVDTGPPGAPILVLPDKEKDTADPPIEYQLDVTPIVQAWQAGSANNGLAIAPVVDRGADGGSQSRFRIYSSKHPRVQQTPKLTVQLRP